MPNVLVPPDDKCNAAYEQISAIARAHALVVGASGGVMTIAIPERQRESGVRDKVLRMHCMVEVDSTDLPPIPQWPKRKGNNVSTYKPKPDTNNDINLSAFEEDRNDPR